MFYSKKKRIDCAPYLCYEKKCRFESAPKCTVSILVPLDLLDNATNTPKSKKFTNNEKFCLVVMLLAMVQNS